MDYIKNVTIIIQKSNLIGGNDEFRLTARVDIDAKLWAKWKRKGNPLDNCIVDVKNLVYRSLDFGMPCPTVDLNMRASQGIKTIEFTEYFNDAEIVKRLGGDPDNFCLFYSFDLSEYLNRNVIKVDFAAKKRVA